jgi:hypothetical protein
VSTLGGSGTMGNTTIKQLTDPLSRESVGRRRGGFSPGVWLVELAWIRREPL